jgi:phosphoribosyl-dephospho-CoA transferase
MWREWGAPAPTHDLIRLHQPIALTIDAPVPSWVAPTLRRTPWVVVRRGYLRDGMLPVGVRGSARHERFAAFLAVAEIADRLSPEDLTILRHDVERQRWNSVPARAALARLAPMLARGGHCWGPIGSVGFEIATGVPTATMSSDLDLVLRQEHRLAPNEAIELCAALTEAAAPVRVDVMLETPSGGVSLRDLAARPACALVRSRDGACLAADPWIVDAEAFCVPG